MLCFWPQRTSIQFMASGDQYCMGIPASFSTVICWTACAESSAIRRLLFSFGS